MVEQRHKITSNFGVGLANCYIRNNDESRYRNLVDR